MVKMRNNSKVQMSILALTLVWVSFLAHSENKVYPVIDLPPYGCEPSGGVKCINTEITKIIVATIDNDSASVINAFPYPRALRMFEKGESPVLVALKNKRLMAQADIIELYFGEFYLVSMEKGTSGRGKIISYLRGADCLSDIAEFIDATPMTVNDYNHIYMMLRANRLDYVIVPRQVYEAEAEGVFKKAKILSKHNVPVMLYLNKTEAKHLEAIKEKVSMFSLHLYEQYHYLFP